MNKENFLEQYEERLNALHKEKQFLKELSLTVITDKDISLDTRWKIYMDVCKHEIFPVSRYIEHFEGKVEAFMQNEYLDGYTMDRNKYISSEHVYDHLNDNGENELLAEFQEQMMAKGIRGFIFDW